MCVTSCTTAALLNTIICLFSDTNIHIVAVIDTELICRRADDDVTSDDDVR